MWAEAIAIGAACTAESDPGIDLIVAVHHAGVVGERPAIASPCGMCRELISDYDDAARVVLPGEGDDVRIVAIRDLLPDKYVRSGRGGDA